MWLWYSFGYTFGVVAGIHSELCPIIVWADRRPIRCLLCFVVVAHEPASVLRVLFCALGLLIHFVGRLQTCSGAADLWTAIMYSTNVVYLSLWAFLYVWNSQASRTNWLETFSVIVDGCVRARRKGIKAVEDTASYSLLCYVFARRINKRKVCFCSTCVMRVSGFFRLTSSLRSAVVYRQSRTDAKVGDVSLTSTRTFRRSLLSLRYDIRGKNIDHFVANYLPIVYRRFQAFRLCVCNIVRYLGSFGFLLTFILTHFRHSKLMKHTNITSSYYSAVADLRVSRCVIIMTGTSTKSVFPYIE